MAKICPSCKEHYPNSQTFCPKCRVLTDFAPEAEEPIARPSAFGTHDGCGYYHMGVGGNMKWFKFLVYFSLFVSMISYAISAFAYILLPVLVRSLADPEWVDTKLLVLFALYGFACVALFIMTLRARKKLVRLQKKADSYYLRLLIIGTAVTAAMNLCMSLLGGMELAVEGVNGNVLVLHIGSTDSIVDVILSTAISAALVYANVVYFRKRRHLFVN